MQLAASALHQPESLFKKYDVYFLAFVSEILIIGLIAFIVVNQFKPINQNNNAINLVLNDPLPDIPEEKEPTKTHPTPLVKEKTNKVQKVQEKTNVKELPKSDAPSEVPYQAPTPKQTSPSDSNSSASSQPSGKSDSKHDPMLPYQSQVRAAIQAAVKCTSAATDMNLSGKTRVQFNLKDSQQSGSHVSTTSGIPMLDNIAINAVQNAKYPSPPEDFIGESKLMTVLVNLSCNN
jgi:outer membrane biosynthesis protein TonB